MTMLLYRPIGLKELELVAATGYTAFPPRLPDQPIFYPVLNEEYAKQIARDWKTARLPYAGFVTRFEIDRAYAQKFDIHTVGGKIHQELWVPAEELDEFNRHLLGKIEVVDAFYGQGFQHEIDPQTNLPNNLLIRSKKDQTIIQCKQAPGVFIPVINPNQCEGKAECVAVCPFDVFTMGILPKKSRAGLSLMGMIKGFGHGWKQAQVTNGSACRECGECVKYCPEKAITLKRR